MKPEKMIMFRRYMVDALCTQIYAGTVWDILESVWCRFSSEDKVISRAQNNKIE